MPRSDARDAVVGVGSGCRCSDQETVTAAVVGADHIDILKSRGPALLGECVGLRRCPAVAGETGRTGGGASLDHYEAALRGQYSLGFSQAGVDVAPVVDGSQRPHNGRRVVRTRQGLGGAEAPANRSRWSGHTSSQCEHDRRWVDPRDRGASAGGQSGGRARPAPDIDDTVAGVQVNRLGGQTRIWASPDDHCQTGEQADGSGEAGVIGVMVRGWGRARHAPDVDT